MSGAVAAAAAAAAAGVDVGDDDGLESVSARLVVGEVGSSSGGAVRAGMSAADDDCGGRI
jgi:hypothetical protein